jgi:hypothetical protein
VVVFSLVAVCFCFSCFWHSEKKTFCFRLLLNIISFPYHLHVFAAIMILCQSPMLGSYLAVVRSFINNLLFVSLFLIIKLNTVMISS